MIVKAKRGFAELLQNDLIFYIVLATSRRVKARANLSLMRSESDLN